MVNSTYLFGNRVTPPRTEREKKEKEKIERLRYISIIGLDLGYFSGTDYINDITWFPQWGIRVGTVNFTNSFGWDILRFKGLHAEGKNQGQDYNYFGSYSFLTGPRFNAYPFKNKTHAHMYCVLRSGVAMIHSRYYDAESCFSTEIETGVHFKYFYLGLSASYFSKDLDYVKLPLFSFHIGFDLAIWKD